MQKKWYKYFFNDFSSYVKNKVAKFKRVKDSIEVDQQLICPDISTPDKQVDAIHRRIFDDRHITVQQIAKTTDITSGSVHTVSTDVLGIRKLPTRWLLWMLTTEC